MEHVEPGSAMVDEGSWAVAGQEFAVRTAKSSYKLCDGAECAFPQVHLAILSLALFVLEIF